MKIISHSIQNLISIMRRSSLVFVSFVILFIAIPSVASNSNKNFTVVLDAGHGGHDVGATDNNLKEKDINLAVSQKVAALLKKKMNNVKVVMTRDDDTFISLQERANIANRNHANLFISIHTNSVDKSNPNRKSVAGASVYALGLQKDQNNLNIARRENSVIELESDYKQKYSGFDPNKDESYIIFEMAQKKNLGNSLKFANLAQKQLVSVAGRADRGVKQAGFWVLWATTMPSVLVELDFICNPSSAQFLGSEEGQDKMAQAIYNAIVSYLSSTSGIASSESSVKSRQPLKSVVKEEASDVETEIVNTPISDSENVLVSSSKKRVLAQPENRNTSKSNYSLASRKRRSESSKKISESRNYETENISLASETNYMAVSTDIENKSNVTVASSDNSKNKKTKKKDNKKNKSKKDNNSKTQKNKVDVNNNSSQLSVNKDISSSSRNKDSHKKTILVASNGELHNLDTKKGVTTISRTTYKIQILASTENLSQDNSRFCGLRPISCFKENGLYKYTYGESQNRSEIENLLMDVKSKIPDAFIIVSRN